MFCRRAISRAVTRIAGRSKNFLRSLVVVGMAKSGHGLKTMHPIGFTPSLARASFSSGNPRATPVHGFERITDGRGSSMFLFTDGLTLTASNPLDVEWVSGKGELVRITD